MKCLYKYYSDTCLIGEVLMLTRGHNVGELSCGQTCLHSTSFQSGWWTVIARCADWLYLLRYVTATVFTLSRRLQRYLKDPGDDSHRELFDLVGSLLCYESTVRYTLRQAMLHPFLRSQDGARLTPSCRSSSERRCHSISR